MKKIYNKIKSQLSKLVNIVSYKNIKNKKFFEIIITFMFDFFKSLNIFGDKISEKILTPVTQEKLEDLGHFQLYKKTSILFRIIMASFLAILLWSIIAKTDQVVRANGLVIPATKVQTVQTVYGGVLDKINIGLSDEVKEGDILFEIDKAQNLVNYESYKAEVEAREKKVKIYEDLFASGSEAEMMLINERLLLSEAQRNLIEYEKRYQNSLLKSQVNGTISKVFVSTKGQVINPGDPLAEIVPFGEELILEVRVPAKDIAKIRTGLKAKIAFTAYDSSIFGMFEGEVDKVATGSTLDEQSQSVFYIARVKVTDQNVIKSKDVIIQSGMEGMVSIIGKKQSVISYFLNPIKKLSQRAFGE